MSVTMKNAVDLDDWVYRFFGFLGAFAYRRKQVPPPSPRACFDEKGNLLRADNILYIYGVPQGGKTVYQNLLVERLREQEEYLPLRVNLQLMGKGLDSVEFQSRLRQCFLNGDSKMKFPFLNLLTDYKTNDLTTLNSLFDGYLSSVNDIFSGNPVQGLAGIKDLALTTVEAGRYLTATAARHRKLFQEEIKSLRTLKKEDPGGTLFDERDIFKFLRYDLCWNAHVNQEKRYVCFVDKYELSRAYLTDRERKEFLLMMNSVPEVVWVLFSAENPGREELRALPRDSLWRMRGLGQKQAMDYLRATLPGQPVEWYDGVYRQTGGYLGLMDLCVRAQKQPGRQFSIPEEARQLRHADGVRPSAARENYARAVERLQEQWFEQVWSDEWEDDYGQENGRENPISFLLQPAFRYAEEGTGSRVQRNLIPCLCYLAEKSLPNLHTIRQYSWQRDAMNITELNDTGQACLREIEACTPLCVEYVEYPGVLYLDPVIVRILTQHVKFDAWLNRFKRECLAGEQNGAGNQEKPLKARQEDTLLPLTEPAELWGEKYRASLKDDILSEVLSILRPAGFGEIKASSPDKSQGALSPRQAADAERNRGALPHHLGSQRSAKDDTAREEQPAATPEEHLLLELLRKTPDPNSRGPHR